jgi:Cu/Ag efflux pump CusA
VVLVRHYQQLQRDGLEFGADLVVRGTGDRVPQILTSALGAAVAFIPFVVNGDAPGFEIVGPMAVVILGGVISSTLLNVVVIPGLYGRFGFVAKPDTAAEDLFVQIPDIDTVGTQGVS